MYCVILVNKLSQQDLYINKISIRKLNLFVSLRIFRPAEDTTVV